MILHATAKLAAKLPAVAAEPIEATDALGGWHGNLYVIDRRQCVMLCHDDTRYVLFLAGFTKATLAELNAAFGGLFLASLDALGCAPATLARVRLALGPLQVDTRTDRSVLSALRVAKGDFEALLCEVPSVLDLDPLAAAAWLNKRPTQARGEWLWPATAMRERVERL